jgi:hypothetical protein
MEGNLEQLLIDFKESLEREIQSMGSRILDRFDTQVLRLDRQGALIQTGSRWTNRMNEWSEKVDTALERKDREIIDLTKRIEKLEAERHRSEPLQ